MKPFISIFIVTVLNFTFLMSPKYAKAEDKGYVSNQEISKSSKDNLENLISGKKVPLVQTTNESEMHIEGEYLVVLSKDVSSVDIQNIANNYDANYSFLPTLKSLNKSIKIVKFVLKDKNKEIINDLYAEKGVLYVEKNLEYNTFAVPALNDPLFPTSNSDYSLSKQWYLNNHTTNQFGISARNAWAYLDAEGSPWNGNPDITVAVLDSGLAYENYSKYGSYSKMSSPEAWSFTKGTEVTDNLFERTEEIANNELNEDGIIFNYFSYCIDNDADLLCDQISGDIYDDVNGLNAQDWFRYWTPYLLENEPVCTGFESGVVNPFGDPASEYRCVPDTFRYFCSEDGMDDAKYHGCSKSDMGHPNDMNGHGTFVSNVIAGKANNGIAGVGIASGVKILPVNINASSWSGSAWENTTSISTESSLLGIVYAMYSGADVINMSYGSTGYSMIMDLYMYLAHYDYDIVLVAASGNSNSTVVNYPAGSDFVISVGASNLDGSRASYSNYGSWVDLSAPVDDGIFNQTYNCALGASNTCLQSSMYPNTPSQFTQFSSGEMAGTSFAAPQVSAVAALVKTMNPTWSAQHISYVIKESATNPNLPFMYPTDLTNGTYRRILNAENAVKGITRNSADLSQRERVFESKKDTDGYLYYRMSTDGGFSSSSWVKVSHRKVYSNASNFQHVEIDVNTGRVLLTYIGDNKVIYTRYADISNTNGLMSEWSTATSGGNLGYTIKSVSSVVNGQNIVQTMVSSVNKRIYNRRSTNAGQTWSNWLESGKVLYTNDFVSMVYEPSSNRLLQAIRTTTDRLNVRYSNDYGVTWTAWVDQARALVVPSLVVNEGSVYISLIGLQGKVLTRVTIDGGLSWKPWILEGYTKGWIYTVPNNTGGVFQAVKWGDKSIWARNIVNSETTVSKWVKLTLPGGVLASSGLRLIPTDYGSYYLFVVASNGNLYHRAIFQDSISSFSWVYVDTSSTDMSVLNIKSLNRIMISYKKTGSTTLYSKFAEYTNDSLEYPSAVRINNGAQNGSVVLKAIKF